MAAVSFGGACALLEAAIAARADSLASVTAEKDFAHALRRLRGGMRDHAWKAGRGKIELDEIVGKFDRRTRQDGFHVLHDWDGKADHVNDDERQHLRWYRELQYHQHEHDSHQSDCYPEHSRLPSFVQLQ